MRLFLFFTLQLAAFQLNAQSLQTPFEKSSGKRCATYDECIRFFRTLDAESEDIHIEEAGPTDAGLPLHVVYYEQSGNNASSNNRLTILINNSIHPGEPDGTDACMLLFRDIATGKIKVPERIRLAVIPVYNIGGALNRGGFSRVNQNGPETYGFRGNAQNLDLNRDFTKCDSREAQSFARIFQQLQPDIFIDNHVSDGADYQHTMTLLSTQYDKLGGETGRLMRRVLDPAIYQSMERQGWPIVPYVVWEEGDPRRGWTAFYDPPRFSAGYAALFHTIAYTPETHMLKPFRQRVESTYALMNTIIEQSGLHAAVIKAARKKDASAGERVQELPLLWVPDTTAASYYTFRGYEPAYRKSAVTGQQRLYYDRSKPFTATVPIYDHYLPKKFISVPSAYIMPQGWHKVADLLALHGVQIKTLLRDTPITVTAYRIDDYKTLPRAYEGHYKHSDIIVSTRKQKIYFRKGDYLIATAQPTRRLITELLEPAGEDSYFAWNFFDAVLQQKEGYSDYRWEDLAAVFLKEHPEIRKELKQKKLVDAAFAVDAGAQLQFIYQRSPWYEAEHLRYPVFRVE
jgi:hypothetical protein